MRKHRLHMRDNSFLSTTMPLILPQLAKKYLDVYLVEMWIGYMTQEK